MSSNKRGPNLYLKKKLLEIDLSDCSKSDKRREQFKIFSSLLEFELWTYCSPSRCNTQRAIQAGFKPVLFLSFLEMFFC